MRPLLKLGNIRVLYLSLLFVEFHRTGCESRFVRMRWFVLVSLSGELLSKEFDAGVYFSRSLTEV